MASATSAEIVAGLTRSANLLDRAQTHALSRQLVQALAGGHAPDIRKAQEALDVLRSQTFLR